MFINPYSIELDANYCIYEEPGRRYIITPETGHHYTGHPVKIIVDGEQVHYDDKSGTIVSFSLEAFRPSLYRSLDHEVHPLAELGFESCFPHLAEQIKYVWPPNGVIQSVHPE